MHSALAILALAMSVTLLAGCASEPAPSQPQPGATSPAQPEGIVYGCPGEEPQETICLAPWTLQPPYFGQPVGLALDPSDAQHLAALTWSPVQAGPGATPDVGGFLLVSRAGVAVSHDGGVTWTEHLIDHGVDPANLVGALHPPAAATWTPEGRLVVAAYYEDTPSSSIGTGGGGIGSIGQSWIGWSDDDGATWTTALLHRPSWGYGVTLTQIADGRLVAAWAGEEGRLLVTWSEDGGSTWEPPVGGGKCYYPSDALAVSGGLLLGCQDPHDWATIKNLQLQRVDVAARQIDGVGAIDTASGSGCSSRGPVRTHRGELVAASGCTSIQLNRSLDGGLSWEAFGEEAVPGLADASMFAMDGLAIGPDGLIAAMVQYSHPADGLACCDGSMQLATWSPEGRLLGNVVLPVFDADDPTFATAYPWLLASPSVAAGPEHTWILQQDAPPGIGWVRVKDT